MRKTLPVFFFILLSCLSVQAQFDLSYYLPDTIEFDSTIPTPKSVLGYEVGEWHVSHDQLVYYMKELARASDRIKIEEHGRTYENRPLLLLTISAPENLAKTEEIKQQRQQLTHPDKGTKVSLEKMPAVVYMGFSIHGNEASGSNASMLTAYYLAAARGEQIEKMLKGVVVLLDPSFNPDGLNRFASWVNSHKGKNLVIDSNNREQNEAWPRGRTNHYWFDLNRDWLPVQHPESEARVRTFHEWKPNILTDHHEMGTNNTFFFQPGVPSRNNPLTPDKTIQLTGEIAKYHAAALDAIGSLYYSKENFDDFYYGKGSTYPDINGGVGILFEQASSRGHAQESEHGVLHFPFTIRNQFVTTLSTFKAAYELKKDLLEHQKTFYETALKEAGNSATKGYIFGSDKDAVKTYHLADLISKHDIRLHKPTKTIQLNGKTFTPENSFIVPLEQPQYRLIRAMFETNTSFEDSLFYDISAWTLPLAFNLNYAAVDKRSLSNLLGEKVSKPTMPQGKLLGDKSHYAYLFEWHNYNSPKVLAKVLKNNLKAKVATEPFTANGQAFDRGTILIPVEMQKQNADKIHELMQTLAQENGITITSVKSGYTEGINLGSPSFVSVESLKVLLLVDDGVSSYDAGEVWHLLDQRYDMAPSLVPISTFNRINLDQYNTIIMVDGNYYSITNTAQEKLKSWIQKGGTVVALQNAGRWLSTNKIIELQYKSLPKMDTLDQRPYNLMEKDHGAQVIGGAIFNTKLDLTHPIAFGYTDTSLPIFRNDDLFMKRARNPYANPIMYTDSPLLAGYISKPKLEQLKGSAAVQISGIGRGKVIVFADNPNFRGFWYGTNKLFANSIFFGNIISGRAAE